MISLNKQNKGFTIVELLIVIVVIGILAGLVITTYNGIQQKARNTERQTDLKALQGQLEAYYAENGMYPATADLGAGGTNGASNVTFIQSKMKGLDKEALRDPNAPAGNYSLATSGSGTDNQYTYEPVDDSGAACTTSGANCTSYKLIANLEGGTTYELDSLN